MKKIPEAILARIVKLALILAAAMVFGVIYGVVTHDRILLFLTLTLAGAGGVRIAVLLLSAGRHEYEIVEGTVLSARRIPIRKCTLITLSDADGVEKAVTVKGLTALSPGLHCRLYLSRDLPVNVPILKSERFRPTRTLFGYEELS